jgi:hypothetical protein
MLVIQALGKLRQKDNKFKASLSYIASPCLKKTNKKRRRRRRKRKEEEQYRP